MAHSWPPGRVPEARVPWAVSASAVFTLNHRPGFSGVVFAPGAWMLTAGMVKTGGQSGGGFATVTRSGLASEYAKPATWYRNPQAATETAGTLTPPLTTTALIALGSWTNA